MGIVTGAFLALLTWLVLIVVLVGWGALPALVVGGQPRFVPAVFLRHALWWGLALVSLVVAGLSLITPLATPIVLGTVLLGSALLGAGAVFWSRRRWTARTGGNSLRMWWWFVGGLVIAQITLAFAALGPATNYDTGLYHLGAIAYGQEFAAIPGLANLYGPLGYSTLEFVWASALGATPWGSEAFRLVNGFLMLAVAADLVLRLRGPRRVGTYVLLVGVVAMWGPMLGMADFWITSPTQDAAAYLLAIILAAYLSDASAGKGAWVADAAVVVVVGIVLLAVRTTMVVFVVTSIVVVIALVIRRRSRGNISVTRPGLAVVIFGAATAGVMGARDYVLSGWLGYPLSIVGFDVEWRATNPMALREATLGFHRNPEDIGGSLEGWGWLSSWVARTPGFWETYLVLALAAALVFAVVLAQRTHTFIPVRRIMLATAPSLLALVIWFVASPPSFRFIWGPLILLFAIPLGWLLFIVLPKRAGYFTAVVLASTAVVTAAALATLVIRIDWAAITQTREWHAGVSLNYQVAPLPAPPVRGVTLPSGLMIQQPTVTDQCWSIYPLCSPNVPPSLTLRGDDLGRGFTQQ